MPGIVSWVLFLVATAAPVAASSACGDVCNAAREMLGDLDPWEPQDLRQAGGEVPAKPDVACPLEYVSLGLIGWYRRSLSEQSVARCPFVISCSVFAQEAIRRYGFLRGICLFIDRNMYRENRQMYELYDFAEMSQGVLKLDDRFFLDPVE